MHAVTVAAYAYTTADLRGAHTDTAHLARPAARRRQAADAGRVRRPGARGHRRRGALGRPRAALERKRLGLDHAAAGALLVGLTEPDDAVTNAIAYHHGGPTGLACPTGEAACVQVADAVAHLLAGNEIDRTLLGIALERLGAGPELLDEVAESAGVAPAGAAGDLSEAVGRLEAVAHTDDLTGLHKPLQLHRHRPPRAGHRRRRHVARSATSTPSRPSTMLHGHRSGDIVLAEVARVLARHGVAGRLGGDEFGVWVCGSEELGRTTAAPAAKRSRTPCRSS